MPLLISAADTISRRWARTPCVGLILGTGLGKVAKLIESEVVIPYADISGFPRSMALSHAGRLVCGTLSGVPVIALEGRSHLYDGYSREELALPVRLLARLGAELLIVTNASGGLNPQFASGDIMLIEDHIDLMFHRSSRHTPCAVREIGSSDAALADLSSMRSWADGTRSVPATFYDPALIEQALAIGRRENLVAHRGTYVALTGPNYETRAEYRFLRRIGGDVVGMSTVPEVIAAAECGLRVLAVSTVTNVARPDAPHKTTAEEVVAIAAAAEPKLSQIVRGIVESLLLSPSGGTPDK